MKITKSQLRQMIRETINEGWGSDEKAFTVIMKNDVTGKTRTVHIWSGGKNETRAGDLAKSSSAFAGNDDWKVASVQEKTDDTVEEASTRNQQRWACAVKDEKPEVAHMCYDTELSGKKKK
jgi:hypothetical protein